MSIVKHIFHLDMIYVIKRRKEKKLSNNMIEKSFHDIQNECVFFSQEAHFEWKTLHMFPYMAIVTYNCSISTWAETN